MLAKRLDVMRKERDARAKPKKAAKKAAAAAPPEPEPVMAGLPDFEFQDPFDDDSGVVELTGADGGVGSVGGGQGIGGGRKGNPRRSKNKKKKRKNRK